MSKERAREIPSEEAAWGQRVISLMSQAGFSQDEMKRILQGARAIGALGSPNIPDCIEQAKQSQKTSST
jgi:hypothetical protein